MFGSKWGFRGRRIEWCYFRFEHIQGGGRRHLGKISNGHSSARGRPTHFLFRFKVEFLGLADLVDLHPVEPYPRGARTSSWKISNEYRPISGMCHLLHYREKQLDW